MFTYELPPERIAQRPSEPRDAARLLVLHRTDGSITHRIFRELPEFLRAGDCLVLNDTQVLPARLFGTRADTGKPVELLLLQPEAGGVYRCLGQPGKRLKPGAKLVFDHGSVRGEVLSSNDGTRMIRLEGEDLEKTLGQYGRMPLPPYIRRPVEPQDADWYQTVYAASPGAVAAPTAGLHFTTELLEKIQSAGISVARVTLHVGWGTFKPVGEEEMQSGRLHEERFRIPPETLETVRSTKSRGGRVVAVGTTVVRTLETCALQNLPQERDSQARLSRPASGTALRGNPRSSPKIIGESVPARLSECLRTPHPSVGFSTKVVNGTTDLFIRPPFRFKVVDAMITNFHLPGTSLLHLICAFAGLESARAVYAEALRERYRFYSYGDAMLIL